MIILLNKKKDAYKTVMNIKKIYLSVSSFDFFLRLMGYS
jgi:hypothetical protein